MVRNKSGKCHGCGFLQVLLLILVIVAGVSMFMASFFPKSRPTCLTSVQVAFFLMDWGVPRQTTLTKMHVADNSLLAVRNQAFLAGNAFHCTKKFFLN